MAIFKDIAQHPDQLFDKVTDDFFIKVQQHFNKLSPESVRAEFYVKTLTVSDKSEYEFGFHSRSKDIFVELFVRDGVVKEVYLDKGCCEM